MRHSHFDEGTSIQALASSASTINAETPVLPKCIGHERELLAQLNYDPSKIHRALALDLKAIHFTEPRDKTFRAYEEMTARGEYGKRPWKINSNKMIAT